MFDTPKTKPYFYKNRIYIGAIEKLTYTFNNIFSIVY